MMNADSDPTCTVTVVVDHLYIDHSNITLVVGGDYYPYLEDEPQEVSVNGFVTVYPRFLHISAELNWGHIKRFTVLSDPAAEPVGWDTEVEMELAIEDDLWLRGSIDERVVLVFSPRKPGPHVVRISRRGAVQLEADPTEEEYLINVFPKEE